MNGTFGRAHLLRVAGAAACVAAGAAIAHLVVLHRADGMGSFVVVLCTFGAGACLWARFEWSRIGARLASLGKLLRVPRLGAVYAGWCTFSMIAKAIVYVPYGIIVMVIAGWVLWEWGSNLFTLLFAVLIAFHGATCLFGSLAGFVTGPSRTDTTDGATTATRAELRRAGLIRER